MYNGTTAVDSATLARSFALTIAGNNNYTLSGSPTVSSIYIYDGQAADRAIPVTQNNNGAFNTYANTTAGLTRHYKLMEDVTLTAPAAGGSNWTPIGGPDYTVPFAGSFDGQGKTISNLTINRTVATDGSSSATVYDTVGMFGIVGNPSASKKADIKNLGLINVSLSIVNTGNAGGVYAGGLVGLSNGSNQLDNCYVTGSVSSSVTGNNVSANGAAGGVVGYNYTGSQVRNCYSTASVTGNIANSAHASALMRVGGVVGWNSYSVIVQNCYATGAVTGTGRTQYVGGVVGLSENTSNVIRNCVALNTSITIDAANGYIGRVAGSATGTRAGNWGKVGEMKRNNVIINPTNVGTTGLDGGNTVTTTSPNDMNPSLERFWTMTTAWNNSYNWDTTTIWNATTAPTLGRPILRGFTAGKQGE
jgi:hypothetical protein